MYQVYANGKLIFDTSLGVEEDLLLLSPKLSLKKNSGGTFSFTLPTSHRYWNTEYLNHIFLLGKNDRVVIYRNGEWLWEGAPSEYNQDIFGNYVIQCKGALDYLDDVKLPLSQLVNIKRTSGYNRDYIWLKQCVYSFTKAVLDYYNNRIDELNSKFSLSSATGILHKKIKMGTIETQNSTTEAPFHFSRIVNFESCHDALEKRILDDFGGQYYIESINNELYLSYRATPNRSLLSTIFVHLGKNLIDYDISENFDLATSVIPLGDEYNDDHPGTSRFWKKKPGSQYDDIIQRANLSFYYDNSGEPHGCRVYLPINETNKAIVQKYGFHEKIIEFDKVVAKYPGTGWQDYFNKYGTTEWRNINDYIGEEGYYDVHETVTDDVEYFQDYGKALKILALDYLENQQFNKMTLAITANEIDYDDETTTSKIKDTGYLLPVSADLFGRHPKEYEISRIDISLDDEADMSIILGGETDQISQLIK